MVSLTDSLKFWATGPSSCWFSTYSVHVYWYFSMLRGTGWAGSQWHKCPTDCPGQWNLHCWLTYSTSLLWMFLERKESCSTVTGKKLILCVVWMWQGRLKVCWIHFVLTMYIQRFSIHSLEILELSSFSRNIGILCVLVLKRTQFVWHIICYLLLLMIRSITYKKIKLANANLSGNII